jgi:hypothetical protein
MDLKALIEAEKNRVDPHATDVVNVPLGDELVEVEFAKLRADEWHALMAACPPRPGVPSDENLGYNQATAARKYPVSRVRVAGEPVDKETWNALLDVLGGVDHNNLGTVIWGLNVLSAIKRLDDLGKARAGQR